MRSIRLRPGFSRFRSRQGWLALAATIAGASGCHTSPASQPSRDAGSARALPQGAADPRTQPGGPSPEVAKAMSDAAARAFAPLWQDGDPWSLEGPGIHQIESLHTWSLLWAQASALAANDDTGRLAAMHAHADRMRIAEEKMELRRDHDARAADLAAVRYFRLDAERRAFGNAHDSELRDAARDVCTKMEAADELGGYFWWVSRFPSAELVERHDWSSRWMEAELTLATTARERSAVASAHLARLQRWERIVELRQQFDAPPPTLLTATYYRLRAETNLLQIEEGNQPAADRTRELQRQMYEIATKLVKVCDVLAEAPGRQDVLPTCLHDWSLRAADLECALAGDPAACRLAFDAHRQRMEACAARVARWAEVGWGRSGDRHAAAYFSRAAQARAEAAATKAQ